MPDGTAALPETIRILGIPWQVIVTDTPDKNDPECAAFRTWEENQIRVSPDIPLMVQRRMVWGRLFSIVYQTCAWGKAEVGSNTQDAITHALYAALRDNSGVIGRWFGWGTGTPEVGEGCLHILGMDVEFKRVPRIPGKGPTTKGQSNMRDLLIMVCADVCPHRAAEIALHELLHATVQSIHPVGDMEEFVDPIGAVLSQVFFDNPGSMMALFGSGGAPCSTP